MGMRKYILTEKM